jgi:hypothetical protein
MGVMFRNVFGRATFASALSIAVLFCVVNTINAYALPSSAEATVNFIKTGANKGRLRIVVNANQKFSGEVQLFGRIDREDGDELASDRFLGTIDMKKKKKMVVVINDLTGVFGGDPEDTTDDPILSVRALVLAETKAQSISFFTPSAATYVLCGVEVGEKKFVSAKKFLTNVKQKID